MQWVVGHGPELCLIVIYIGDWSVVDSLQWNVESNSKLDSKGASTPMGPNGPRSNLIYHHGMVYKRWIDYKFILICKGVLVITQYYIGDS